MTSVDWSITITAAVPRPDFWSRSVVEIHDQRRRILDCGKQGTEEPPGITALRLSHPPLIAAAMDVDQLSEGDRHRLFDHAGLVHMARRSAKILVPALFCAAEAGEPCRRRGAGSSAPRRWTRRCSPWSGSRRARRPPGTAASSAACPSCPRGFRAAPSPRRRCTRRRRGGGRGRNPSPSRRRSCRGDPAS